MAEDSKKPTTKAIAKAVHTLDHDGNQVVEAGDDLTTGYRSTQGEYAKLPLGKRKA